MCRPTPGGLVPALHAGARFIADHGFALGLGPGSSRRTTRLWHVANPGAEECLPECGFLAGPFGGNLFASKIGQRIIRVLGIPGAIYLSRRLVHWGGDIKQKNGHPGDKTLRGYQPRN